MANHYLKNCKYAHKKQQDQFGFLDFITDTITEFSEASGLQDAFRKGGNVGVLKHVATTPSQIATTVGLTSPASVGSPIKTGTDGWAEYFWDTVKKKITYTNPNSGKKVVVDAASKIYNNLANSPKIRWKDSTASAMAAQKAKVTQSLAVVPSSSFPDESDFMMEPEKGFVGKAIDYAKENPLIVGGTALGVIAIIGGAVVLSGSKNEHGLDPIPPMDELEKMRAQMLMPGVKPPMDESIFGQEIIEQQSY